MKKNLLYYWRINLAVLLGAAVATAVLTGALLVGDSVKGSLRDLILDRLGNVDHALVADRYFREKLATDLQKMSGFENDFDGIAPGILITGTAISANTKARASNINILGMDNRFSSLYFGKKVDEKNSELSFLKKQPDKVFESIVINQALQSELGIEVGDQILLHFEKQSDIHRESLFGNTESSEILQSVRLVLTAILPDNGIGRFGIRVNQNLTLNAYVSLSVLQNALEQNQKVNAIFVSDNSSKNTHEEQTPQLQTYLKNGITLEDLGLQLKIREDHFALQSNEFILSTAISSNAKMIAEELDIQSLPIFTYMANTITANGKSIPYSTITALNPPNEIPFFQQNLPLEQDDILLNEWAANDLAANVGDEVDIAYYSVGLSGELSTEHAVFKLKGILPITGLAADADLAPEFPGIHDSDNMADWNPPFPIDLKLVRPKDEKYWDDFKATPKAFVSEEVGQKLWRSRFGNLTSIRFGAMKGSDIQSTQAKFEEIFLRGFSPERAGLLFQPVKQQGLQASSGSTDFGMLFIGFSIFLIVSSALLVGLLFRLGIEQRSSEIGILLSVGYNNKQIRTLFFKEVLLIGGVGCLLGLIGAILYSELVMTGLRTWWVGAIGSPFLFLHITPSSLIIGYFIAFLVVLFATWRTIRQLGKIPTPSLLAGSKQYELKHSGRFMKISAVGSLILALLLVVTAIVMRLESSAIMFMSSGSLMLISGLCFLSIKFRALRKQVNVKKFVDLQYMSARNSSRFPGRSMICVALVACASFMIVAVGANRRDFSSDVLKKNSGAGGFALVAESDVGLHENLNSENGRFELGFNDDDSEQLSGATAISFRLMPGEDVSCLNLYKPQKPRILGVTDEQIQRGGFSFQSVAEPIDNPWQLLEQEIEPGVIPAIADYNSAMWILKVGLGNDLAIQDEFGEEVKLRFVGLLRKSIFQSEVLISESNFVKLFPSKSGYSYFLFQTALEQQGEIATLLESNLSNFGFDVTSTAEKLNSYQVVENTYLAVFQTLGGLGLLLGTLGLGIVLFRNALERKGELATMRAFGFRKSKLSLILLFENGFLILAGIGIGTVAAIIAVLPHILADFKQVPWLPLVITLAVVFLCGLAASGLAVISVLRFPLLPALKAEH